MPGLQYKLPEVEGMFGLVVTSRVFLVLGVLVKSSSMLEAPSV